ncbi:AMP-binding protein [bacterium]|nr:AMP-binding protein [bacterium]
MARRSPTKRAVVFPAGRDGEGRVAYTHLTFRQLDDESDRYAHGFERIGIRRGTRTVLMVRPSLEFFALTFALFKVGATVVLIDPGMGRRNVLSCLEETKPEALVAVPLAHAARTVFRALRSVRVRVTVGRRWFWGGHRLRDIRDDSGPYTMAPTRPDEPAAILFTTGSTGPPKGVVYEHAVFDAQVRFLRAQYGIAPDEIDLPTFPLFALFDAALGMTAVIPDMDPTRPALVDPRKIVEAIQDHGVTHMFGSPALLDRLSRLGASQKLKLPSLRRVISAGAPMPPSTLERMQGLLPSGAEVHTPYGATEALPVTSIGSREVLEDTRAETERGEGTCVGAPVGDIEVRILKISDEPIPLWSDELVSPRGEIGEIAVKGSVVTRSYDARPDANALAKIQDGTAIWHRMGDVGRQDERGRLWFCGRKAHRVVTASGTLFTEPCEAIFNTHPGVYRSALVGVGPRGSQRPVILVELEKDARVDPGKLRDELLALARANPVTRSIETFLVHPGFPVDIRHNAKIFREKLAPWAAERLS